MNIKSILLTTLLTAVATIVASMFLSWVQSRKAVLTYNYVRSIPFEDGESQVFIQQFEILNSGNDFAEDVVLLIHFPNSEIEKTNIRINNAIKYEKDIKVDTITVSIKSLNPKEGLSLSVLLKGQSSFTHPAPKVSLRAKGVVGEKVGSDKSEKKIAITAVIAAYIGLLTFGLSSRNRRKALFLIMRGSFLGFAIPEKEPILLHQQKFMIASLLSLYGLPKKARDCLRYCGRSEYWVEADVIAAEAIESDESDRRKTIKVLSHLVEDLAIAEPSKAVVHYNIARIQKSLGLEFQEEIDLAKKFDEKEVSIRLKRDPLFCNDGF